MSFCRQLVYGSSSIAPVSTEVLASILQSSRRNNAAVGVTGALLYDDGCFLQVLEGEPDAVAGVFSRVLRDDRHRRMLTLLDRVVPERTFPEWSMGLIDVDALSGPDRQSVRALSDMDSAEPGPVRHLMVSFRGLTGGLARRV